MKVKEFISLIHILADEAREISKTDPQLLTGSFEEFERVMWPNDDVIPDDCSRDSYKLALKITWDALH